MVEKTWFFVKNHHTIKTTVPCGNGGYKKKRERNHLYIQDPDGGIFFSMMQTEAEQEISLDGVTLGSSLLCLNSANLPCLMHADKM